MRYRCDFCLRRWDGGGGQPASRLVAVLCPALLWMGGGTAPAQDALRGVLALDQLEARYQNPVAEVLPDSPHLGPVQLALGLYTGVDFNDNVFLVQTEPRSDDILHAGVTFGANWPATERSALRLGGDFGYVYYVNHSVVGGLEVAPNSALTYDVQLPDGTLTLFDQFEYTRDVVAQPALTGLAVLPRLDNTIGGRANWLPGEWMLQGGYSHENLVGETAQYAYLTHASESVNARGGWRFGETSQVGLESTACLTTYQEAIQADNQSVSLGPFLEWQATPAIYANLRGGPAAYFFDAVAGQPSFQLVSYYFNLELRHQLTDFVSQQVTAGRGIQLGYNPGGNYIEQLTVGYSLSWALTAHLTVNAAFTYAVGSQPLGYYAYSGFSLQEVVEHFERCGLNPGISWNCTDHTAVSLAYFYWRRVSDVSDRRYVQNSVALRLSYSF